MIITLIASVGALTSFSTTPLSAPLPSAATISGFSAPPVFSSAHNGAAPARTPDSPPLLQSPRPSGYAGPLSVDGFALGMTLQEMNRVRASRGHRKPLTTELVDDRGRFICYIVHNDRIRDDDDVIGPFTWLDKDKRLSSCSGRSLTILHGNHIIRLTQGDTLAAAEQALGKASELPKVGCGNNLTIVQWQVQNHFVQAILYMDHSGTKVALFVISTRPQKASYM